MSEIKIDCELIQDLLPLYQDGVCSGSSRRAVEEHLKGCDNCMGMARKLGNYEVNEVLMQEKNTVLKTHEKMERRRTLTVGMVTAGVLMVPVIVCLICNLAIGHALDWFFVVLAAMLLTASLTVLPLVVQKQRGVWTIAGFTGSLLLLLLVCCIYTHGNWFLVASASCVLGISVFFAPYVICNIPLPQFFSDKKGLSVMVWDTMWLYALIGVCGVFVKGGAYYWHVGLLTTTYCIWLPWFIFLVCRYFKANRWIKAGLIVIASGVFTSFTNDVLSAITGIQNGGSIFHAGIGAGGSLDNLDVLNGTIMLTILIASVITGVLFIIAGLGMARQAAKGDTKDEKK